MAYVDKFLPDKHLYVNKDDPEFDVAVHPSISAERLRAFSTGIVDALTAADEIAARTTASEDNINMLDQRTCGIVCEIHRADVVVAVSDWVDNTFTQRLEAVIYDEFIRPDTDVDLTIQDAQKGRFAIDALNPQVSDETGMGYVLLYTTGEIPDEPIVFHMSVKEVRSFVAN